MKIRRTMQPRKGEPSKKSTRMGERALKQSSSLLKPYKIKTSPLPLPSSIKTVRQDHRVTVWMMIGTHKTGVA